MSNPQLPLFTFKEMLPRTKVPISAERIREVKELIAKRDGKKAAEVLREIREGLENYERRLSNRYENW